MGDAAKHIEKLASKNPNAVQLAKLVSLAMRIEPELLRKARLELLPDADAGAEADLWFSDLVESRNPTAIVLRRDVCDILRDKLAENRLMLDAAWRLIETVHKNISPALRVEEKLTRLALSGRKQQLKELLRSILATMVQPQRAGLLAWAARAFPRLPESVRESEEGQMLAFGLSLRLEEPEGYNISRTTGALPEWAAWLTPTDVPMARFGVRLVQGAVEFGSPGKQEDHPIELPKTTPILVELSWYNGPVFRTERVRLNPGKVTTVDIAPRIYVSQQPDARTGDGEIFLHGLRDFFSAENVITTARSLQSSRDIAIAIETVLKSCHVVLVLIDPGRFESADGIVRKQTTDPLDVLRMEFRGASDAGLKIIPVLLDGAGLPQGEGLPEELAPLMSLNPYVYEPDSGRDLDDLIAVVQGDVKLQTVLGQRYLLSPFFGSRQKRKDRRPPIVHITYEVEQNGTIEQKELPFVVGVMADLSGNLAEPLPEFGDRKFIQIDRYNYDQVMKTIRPRLAFKVADRLTDDENFEMGVELRFESMDDFHPERLAEQVIPLRKLLGIRWRLFDLTTILRGNDGLYELLQDVVSSPEKLETLGKETSVEASENDVLIEESKRVVSMEDKEWRQSETFNKGQFREEQSLLSPIIAEENPATEQIQQARVKELVGEFVSQLMKGTMASAEDPGAMIYTRIAQIDKSISDQLNEIMHHADFQHLEAAWRGLYYLVVSTETDTMLKIRVMDASKEDLYKTLKDYMGTGWDMSPVFTKVYGEEYGQFGGEPYGCLVGDYYFDHRPPDVELLGEMAKIAAAAHAPFITGASSSVMQMESWEELSSPADLAKIFGDTKYAAWRSLRDSEDSRYLGLAMPRFLARLPYGAKTVPVEKFDFEEETEAADSRKYLWANAAYAMATNITRAFAYYRWCSRIRGVDSGGAVEGLPVHTFPTDDGGLDMKCPTEIGVSDRREAELAKLGFMPLIHRKNSDFAAFISAQSLQKPAEYEDPFATANVNREARLPYIFACCRFAHYLKCMVRDKIGSFKERHDIQVWLQKWIMQYVDTDPSNSSEVIKARYPLAAAEIVVETEEGNPGYYIGKFYLRPQYQLEGLTEPIRLLARFPSVK